MITENDQAGTRLDVLLNEKYPELSRTRIQKLIKDQMVLVNGQPGKNNYQVRSNDEITFSLPEDKELDLTPVKMDLDIRYEDEDVVVINKPKGLSVHPANTDEATLVHGLLAEIKGLSGINGVQRPGIVHRLDKDTSGLLIVAKNDRAHNFLAGQFKDRSIKRKYLALVHGVIPHDYGTIEASIGRDTKDRKKMTVTAKNSKEAVTNFKVIRRYRDYTLVECELLTGRTHQIRVHLQYIGYPLVGDLKYGRKKTRTEGGQMLHAYKLSFIVPKSKEVKEIETELPKEFAEVLAELEKEEGKDGNQGM